MIPLDIFHRKMHNKAIETPLEAWLTFLSDDNPESIIALITKYPEFKAMYETLYLMCQNTERVMGMFSEELRELDRNTVKYMIEEQQKEIDNQKEKLSQQKEELTQQKEKLSQQEEELTQQKEKLSQQEEQLSQQKEQLSKQTRQLTQKDEELEKLRKELAQLRKGGK